MEVVNERIHDHIKVVLQSIFKIVWQKYNNLEN